MVALDVISAVVFPPSLRTAIVYVSVGITKILSKESQWMVTDEFYLFLQVVAHAFQRTLLF